jgi:acyl-CoA synthetase (AMP-forming)/AMP-acid ligase II
MIITGEGCIISSWNLGKKDICLNMMPLFHVGGIMRNILSPILSGGSVIVCTAFDAALFWNVLVLHKFTWYYAAPTMHHAILKASQGLLRPQSTSSVRYIANAAGGLLPVLAQSLKDTFPNAVILTSYGMTECMPISSPPQDYALDPSGTSGKAVGPDIIITNEDHTDIETIGKVGYFL